MKTIQISNYSIYSDGWYDETTANFIKLYKGIRVNAELTSEGIHFSIRGKKTSDTIWVRADEKMNSLVFNDEECSITCNFERREDNKSKSSLTFSNEVYLDLKNCIPAFLLTQGCSFKMETKDKILILEF